MKWRTAGVYLAFLFITFLAIRGRLARKSPIRWGTAFTSEHNFTNQLGLNPVFTFLQSGIEKLNAQNRPRVFMDREIALAIVKNYYGTAPAAHQSPLERKESRAGSPVIRYNVVLVLMESMSSFNLRHFGNTENITPVLDGLFDQSLAFTNFYSDGIHTFNGVYSSLFGMPSLPNHHHMKDLNNQQAYGGLAKALVRNGYQTLFFTSHDEQFDNAGGFLTANGFQRIISQKDYPGEDVINALGVPDHVLFREGVKRLDEIAGDGQPFFAALLTASNHGPYEIPEGINFKPHSEDIKRQLVEYADWSVGEFLRSCRQKSWFHKTIFLFTGDHGAVIGDKDINVTYHRVPLLVFAPGIVTPRVDDRLGGQIDIFPTTMGLLGLGYTNNSFGINLIRDKRTFITFSYDENYGAFGYDDYYIIRNDRDAHYRILPEAKDNPVVDIPQRRDSMRNFTLAVLQTNQWMIENRLMK
jgi:phosphoglycerol transferase MdoB-like AlkP superfamily enzyme